MNKLIIAAGVILVILIAVTLFVSSFFNKNKTSQQQSTLLPTGILNETGGGSIGRNPTPTLTTQEKQQLEQKVADINNHILSTDQADKLNDLKKKLPVSTDDFALGYSEALGQFYIQKKTPQTDVALQKYFQDSNFLDVYQHFPDLFVNTEKPVDQAIQEAEQNLANIKEEFYKQQQQTQPQSIEESKQQQQTQPQQQSSKTSSLNTQTNQQSHTEKQQQALFFDFVKSLITFNLDTNPNDDTGGVSSGGGGGNSQSNNGTFTDQRISKALMDIFIEAGNKVNIAPKLLAAIMYKECTTVLYWPQNQIINHPTLVPNDRPCYFNGFAYGPMQFIPGTWSDWAPYVKDIVKHQPNVENIRDAVFGAALKLKAAAQAKDPFNLTQQEVFKAAYSYNPRGCPSYCQSVWDYYNSRSVTNKGGGNYPQSTNINRRVVGKTIAQ